MEYKDYYKTLGVERNATPAEIKKAFRKQALKFHPDRNPGNKQAEEKFKDLNEANEVLSDPQKRSRYDQLGQSYNDYTRGGGNPGNFNWNEWTGSQGNPRSQRGQQVSQEDLENMFGGGFSDFFSSIFGGMYGGASPRTSQSRPARSARPATYEHPVQITLDEAYNGSERFLEIEGRRYQVKIPAGARTGTKVRLQGVGPSGQGDLYLVIEVAPDPRFERAENDLTTEVSTDLYTAVLGGSVNVPTPGGSVLLTIPSGTQPNQKFRLAGRGMPHLRAPQTHGDLFAVVRVTVPRQLTPEQRSLFEKLSKL
ncbi:MAG: J domain-containing protein [Anaerolineaceae bacterium]|nr:J domain-containing protein [Anaerolineaceae bacterium]